MRIKGSYSTILNCAYALFGGMGVSLLPAAAHALESGIVVVRGPYTDKLESKTSEVRSQLIADSVLESTKDKGIAVDNTCDSSECLAEVAQQHKAALAICVLVDQIGFKYQLRLIISDGQIILEEKTAPFDEIREAVKTMVQHILDERFPKPVESHDTKELPLADGNGKISGGTEPSNAESIQDEAKKRQGKLGPSVFWTSATITGALSITWAIVEGTGYAKWKGLPDNPTTAEKNSVERHQLASRILLGTMTAGVLATTVLGVFFTDFGNDTVLSISPQNKGTILFVQGSF